jgi:CheY-like chemotaxis protein
MSKATPLHQFPDVGPSILVADNDIIVRGVIRAILTRTRHEVLTAADGNLALSIVQQKPLRLCLLDVEMPGLNGFEVCERIRELPDCRHTPIVMLTFHQDSRTREAAYRVGATAFMTKPFRPDQLLFNLMKLIGIPTPKPLVIPTATGDKAIQLGAVTAWNYDRVRPSTVMI